MLTDKGGSNNEQVLERMTLKHSLQYPAPPFASLSYIALIPSLSSLQKGAKMAVATAHCSCSLHSLSSRPSPRKSVRVSMWLSSSPHPVRSVRHLLRHLPRCFSAAESAFFPSSSTATTDTTPSSMRPPLEVLAQLS